MTLERAQQSLHEHALPREVIISYLQEVDDRFGAAYWTYPFTIEELLIDVQLYMRAVIIRGGHVVD